MLSAVQPEKEPIMQRRRIPEDTGPLPGAAAPLPSASGFVVCPLVCHQGLMGQPLFPWQHVYQWAFEQAQAVVRPSRLERLQAALWN
jgi:hypothetical protein